MVSGCWFAMGYILAWTGFSLLATYLQWWLDKMALLSPYMVIYSPTIGALVFVMAGVWQLSPVKEICLQNCRHPFSSMMRIYVFGQWGAVMTGLRHGLYCIGCCWVLMMLLFVGGVMNLVWVLAISLFVLTEKLFPAGSKLALLSGITMVTGGAGFILSQL